MSEKSRSQGVMFLGR